ncbi:MAG: hypothetical protein MZV64_41880 [Ignavibacteriales bacterium]|nr:hypothetical protein [Ignavibacteriales bacterium]
MQRQFAEHLITNLLVHYFILIKVNRSPSQNGNNKVKSIRKKRFYINLKQEELRNEGYIPGVFYSKNNQPIHINVADKAINPLVFTAKTHLISLQLEGHDEYECIIKDVQFDPVTDKINSF